jgi:hypothetical protein
MLIRSLELLHFASAKQCCGTFPTYASSTDYHHLTPYQELIQLLSVSMSICQINLTSESGALQPQEQRGAANRIATTAMSLSKAFAPAGAGTLYVQASSAA